MKKLIAALAAFFLVFSMAVTPSSALDRTQHLTGLNPPSTWLNMQQRDERIGLGTFLWNALGDSSTAYAGEWSGCTTVPATGLYVAVSAGAVEDCAVYQLLAEEVTGYGGYPSGVGTFLPTDSTQVVLQGLVPAGSTTANIGPMGVGSTTGQSIANLIECKVVTSDTTSQTVNIVSAGGAVSAVSANRDRVDRLFCQDKQSASATTPTVPTVDSGYVAISVVTVPYGTSTVTTGMVAASTLQGFYGFLQLNSTGGVTVTQAVATGVTGLPSMVVQGNGTNSNCCLQLQDTTNTGTTPNKFLRANGSNGALEVVNSAGNTVIDQFSDTGAIGAYNGVIAYDNVVASCVAMGIATVSCPGINQSGDLGENFVIANSSTLGWRWLGYTGTTPTTVASMTPTGSFTTAYGLSTRTGTNAYTQVLPVYTNTGGAVGNTWHQTFASCSTSSSSTCSVTLSGAGAFTSSTSYSCSVTTTQSSSGALGTQAVSGTSLTLFSTSSGTYTLTAACLGY